MFKKLFICYALSLFFFNTVNAGIDINARTAILLDYDSGEILFEKEPDVSIYPASMTKIMTSILAFDLIKSGDLKLDEKFYNQRNKSFACKLTIKLDNKSINVVDLIYFDSKLQIKKIIAYLR